MQLHEVINNLNKDISNKSRFSFKKLKEILSNEFGINDRREVIKDPSLLTRYWLYNYYISDYSHPRNGYYKGELIWFLNDVPMCREIKVNEPEDTKSYDKFKWFSESCYLSMKTYIESLLGPYEPPTWELDDLNKDMGNGIEGSALDFYSYEKLTCDNLVDKHSNEPCFISYNKSESDSDIHQHEYPYLIKYKNQNLPDKRLGIFDLMISYNVNTVLP